MSKITYDDIKRLFSKDDLSKYDLLCSEFVRLTARPVRYAGYAFLSCFKADDEQKKQRNDVLR